MSPIGARLLALAFDPDVARRAGVGRMTVYRRFGSHARLVDTLTVRECRRCLDRIAGALDPSQPMDERLASLLVATLEVIREHPLLERLARVEPEALLRELGRRDSEVPALVRGFLAGLIRQGQDSGELTPGDPELLAELGIRLGLSFVLMPDSVLPVGDQRATRDAVRGLLSPLTL